MQILAVETSGRLGSLAILHGEADGAHLLREVALGGERRTAQALAPALRDLLSEVNCTPKSIGLVAVAVGPGSFTGLRIGVTTAKLFAYAVGAKITGVNTLEVIAARALPSTSPIWTVMDAQRQELFAAKFEARPSDHLRDAANTQIISQEAWLTQLQPGDRVTGPALRRLVAQLPAGVSAVADELWQPTAAAVGQLAWHLHLGGEHDDVWTIAPVYYRPSAAEEKAARHDRPSTI